MAIIGILASLLLPALRQARDAALTVACLSKYRTVGLAITMYAEDNDYTLPHAAVVNGSWNDPYAQVRPYADPYFGGHSAVLANFKAVGMNSGYCPVWPGGATVKTFYGYLVRIQDPQTSARTTGVYALKSLDSWHFATFAFSRWYYDQWWMSVYRVPKLQWVRSPSLFMLAGEAWQYNSVSTWDMLYYNPRHGDAAPVVHADGSAEKVAYQGEDSAGGPYGPLNSAMSERSREFWGPYFDSRWP